RKEALIVSKKSTLDEQPSRASSRRLLQAWLVAFSLAVSNHIWGKTSFWLLWDAGKRHSAVLDTSPPWLDQQGRRRAFSVLSGKSRFLPDPKRKLLHEAGTGNKRQ